MLILCPERLGQRSNLLIEEILSLLPDTGVFPVLQLEQAREQGLAEHLRTLTRQKRREVVDADHTQASDLVSARQCNGNRRLVESGCNIIDWDRVMWVGPVNETSYNDQ